MSSRLVNFFNGFSRSPFCQAGPGSGSHARIDPVIHLQDDVAKRFATIVGLPAPTGFELQIGAIGTAFARCDRGADTIAMAISGLKPLLLLFNLAWILGNPCHLQVSLQGTEMYAWDKWCAIPATIAVAPFHDLATDRTHHARTSWPLWVSLVFWCKKKKWLPNHSLSRFGATSFDFPWFSPTCIAFQGLRIGYRTYRNTYRCPWIQWTLLHHSRLCKQRLGDCCHSLGTRNHKGNIWMSSLGLPPFPTELYIVW